MEEIRACFGIHIEACHNKRSGRQFTPLPCAEEMIPPALVAQQAAIAAAMSYVFIVGCFHDSKLIAISRGNAGILHYLLSALMVIASHRIRAYSLPKRPLRITFAGRLLYTSYAGDELTGLYLPVCRCVAADSL